MNSQIIADYLKCVVANRFTLLGLVGLASGIGNEALLGPSAYATASMYAGSILLGATTGGYGTYRIYQKTKKHIRRTGRIVPEFRENIPSFYCDNVGFKLASKEAGLENRL